MFENLDELRNYIYVNFTPQDRKNAINFYSEKAGVGLEEAEIEVDKIYEKRQNAGMVLPTPRQWTPVGQQYEMGKRLYQLSIMLIIIMTIIFIPASFIAITRGELIISKTVTFFIFLGIFTIYICFFIFLAWMGKRKMKKYEKQYLQLKGSKSVGEEQHNNITWV